MQIRITGGRVIDPGHFDGTADIVVEDGKIARIVENSQPIGPDQVSNTQHPGARIIDASGKIVTPGLIDMHVHLREPGHEYKETIESGCRAAAWGGFSAVCCMPNTNPVNDSRQVTEYIRTRAEQLKLVRVFPVAAISKGIEGKTRCDFEALKQAGAVAVSDDGNPVMNSRMMRDAMEAAGDIGLKVISHCEDISLAADGAMHEGAVARNLSELTQAPVHIAHVSAAESVRAIRDAKARGIRITAETAPHYFTITEKAVRESGTLAKMNPPLGTETDREAICQGLADDTIDAIATDHAPHSIKEKQVDFSSAANGIVGLETAVSLSLRLVQDGVLSLGQPADITVLDPDVEYTVNSDNFQSLSRNTPFEGWQLKGRPIFTLVGGRVVYECDIN